MYRSTCKHLQYLLNSAALVLPDSVLSSHSNDTSDTSRTSLDTSQVGSPIATSSPKSSQKQRPTPPRRQNITSRNIRILNLNSKSVQHKKRWANINHRIIRPGHHHVLGNMASPKHQEQRVPSGLLWGQSQRPPWRCSRRSALSNKEKTQQSRLQLPRDGVAPSSL